TPAPPPWAPAALPPVAPVRPPAGASSPLPPAELPPAPELPPGELSPGSFEEQPATDRARQTHVVDTSARCIARDPLKAPHRSGRPDPRPAPDLVSEHMSRVSRRVSTMT